jgi:hypothetical protein
VLGGHRGSYGLCLCVLLRHESQQCFCACSQDGTIQHEVKLTGEVSTTLASPEDGTDPKHGELASSWPHSCSVLQKERGQAGSLGGHPACIALLLYCDCDFNAVAPGTHTSPLNTPVMTLVRAGTMVAPNVVAAYHQHLFCARLDLALDDPQGGKDLVVSEVFYQPFLLWATSLSSHLPIQLALACCRAERCS